MIFNYHEIRLFIDLKEKSFFFFLQGVLKKNVKPPFNHKNKMYHLLKWMKLEFNPPHLKKKKLKQKLKIINKI